MIKRSVAMLFMLSACSSNVQGTWKCPNPTPRGAACMNISAADSLVTNTGSNTQEANPVNRQVQTEKPLPLAAGNTKQEFMGPSQQRSVYDFVDKDKAPEVIPTGDVEEPEVWTRTPETVARVWFAPFIDKYNNRHDESYIYIINQESTWRMK